MLIIQYAQVYSSSITQNVIGNSSSAYACDWDKCVRNLSLGESGALNSAAHVLLWRLAGC
jgi:hypothetical protein